jgi:hypothetical protein
MTMLHDDLAYRLPKLKFFLREAGYGDHDIAELIRLFAGLYVLLCFVVDDNGFDRVKVNQVLRLQIGSGHSWYSSLKYLTGERAKAIFIARMDVIREIGGSDMVRAFNEILPQAREALDAL